MSLTDLASVTVRALDSDAVVLHIRGRGSPASFTPNDARRLASLLLSAADAADLWHNGPRP